MSGVGHMGARRSSDGQTQVLGPEEFFSGTDVVTDGDIRIDREDAAMNASVGDGEDLCRVPAGPSVYVAERLAALYQATLEQPVPDRFLELLEKLDRGEGQG